MPTLPSSVPAIQILGPVQLIGEGGSSIPVGGAMRRNVLAVLALELNHPIPRNRLINDVWDNDPPPQALAALRGHVVALRRILPAGFELESRAGTYILRGDPDTVDYQRFAALREQARVADDVEERARILQTALDMWRGSAVAGLSASALEHAAAGALQEDRLAALEDWASCQLRLGTGERAVPALAVAARSEALRESLAALLIRCLGQAGRAAEALETYQWFTERLGHELGVKPSKALLGARASVPGTFPPTGGPPRSPSTAPAPAPRRLSQLPRRTGHFVGRSQDLAWLDRLLLPDAPQPRLAVVVGAAGMGKTSLVAEWAHKVAAHFPDGVLYADLRGLETPEPDLTTAVLGKFLRALGADPMRIPTDPAEGMALFESMTRELRLLIVLDNIVDATQLAQLQPAVGGCATVATSRASLVDVIATHGAAWRTLAPLAPEEAGALLGTEIGIGRLRAEPDAAARITQLCDHLPMALKICAARLAARPGIALSGLLEELEDEQLRLDVLEPGDGSGIAVALRLTHEQLAPTAKLLLALLGHYSGPEIGTFLAATLLDADPAAARQALSALSSFHLLAEEKPGRYTQPDLVRLFSRRLLQQTVPPDASEAALLRLMDHQLNAAADAAEPLMNYPWPLHRAPGAQRRQLEPTRRLTRAQAMEWFHAEEPALRLLAGNAVDRGWTDYAWHLVDNLYLPYFYGGLAVHQAEAAESVLDAARAAADRHAVARMQGSLGTALAALGQGARALQLLSEAVAAAETEGDLVWQLSANVILGWACGRMKDDDDPVMDLNERRRAALDRAESLAAKLGQRKSRILVMHMQAQAARARNDLPDSVRRLRQALDLATVEDDHQRTWVLYDLARSLIGLDRFTEARGPATRAMELIRLYGHPQARTDCQAMLDQIARNAR